MGYHRRMTVAAVSTTKNRLWSDFDSCWCNCRVSASLKAPHQTRHGHTRKSCACCSSNSSFWRGLGAVTKRQEAFLRVVMDVVLDLARKGHPPESTHRSGRLWRWVLEPGWESEEGLCLNSTFHSKETDHHRSDRRTGASCLHLVTSDNPRGHGRCCTRSRLVVS